MKLFHVQVVMTVALLVVCLTNIVSKQASDLKWEKETVLLLIGLWITSPTEKS